MEMPRTTTGAVAVGSGGPTATPGPETFAERLGRLTADQIESLACCLRAELGSAEGEIAWWRATMGVDRSLRCARRGRAAGAAAHEASAAVLRAAERAGIRTTERDAVTLVARAASDVARALVAGANALHPPVAGIAAWRTMLAVATA